MPGALADLDLKEAAQRLTTRFWGAVAVAKHGAIHLPPGGSYTITNGMLAHRPMKGMPIVTASAWPRKDWRAALPSIWRRCA